MKQLFIDSSTNLLYIAVGNQGHLIEETYRIGKKDHGKHVVDRIDQLLKRRDLTIDDINAIYVGSGPGSYTGLRVSVMVAKMIAYTKQIDLYEVSSLFFLSSGYHFIKAPMIDARNENVFSAIYHEDETLLVEGLRKTVHLQELAVQFHAKPVMLDEFHYSVDIKCIMKHAKKVDDVHAFIPNYLRETQAERNL